MNKIYLSALLVVVLAALGFWFFTGSDNDAVIADISPRAESSQGITIVAFGDSLTAGYGLAVKDAYPAQLESALQTEGYDVRVINSGVSGETTKGNLERASFIRNQNPDIVLLGIGGNDALRLLPLSETEANLRQTIETLQQGSNPPVVVLLKMQAPLTSGLGYKQDFDALYTDLADEYGLVLIPFLTAELFLDSANKQSDGIHYNATGYQKVVDQYLLPELTKILDQLEGR